jgi:general secretion pathway protein D
MYRPTLPLQTEGCNLFKKIAIQFTILCTLLSPYSGDVAWAQVDQIQEQQSGPVPDRQSPARPRPRARAPRVAPGQAPASRAQNLPSTQGDSTPGEVPALGAPPTEPLFFDFTDQPLFEIVKFVSKFTPRTYIIDQNISNQNVTVMSHSEIPPELAFEVLESILSIQGFSITEVIPDHLYNITQTSEAIQSANIPFIKGSNEIPGSYDTLETHIVAVLHAAAADLQPALQILGSKNANISTYQPTNTLIITDTADGLQRMFSFLESVDIPGFDTKTEIFTLEYTRAEVVAEQLTAVLMDDGAPPTAAASRRTATPARPSRPSARNAVPGAPAGQVIGSREEVLRTVADERLNALIVVASEGMMARTRDLLKRLDVPTPPEADNLHIYSLLNADAEAIVAALQPLTATTPRRQGGGGQGGGQTQSANVQPFEQEVQVTRHDPTNSLIIVASPQDYKVLSAFIARLDVPQRQVFVEAMVMDVTISDNYSLSVDVAGLTNDDVFGVTSTSTISQLVNVTALVNGIATGGNAGGLAAATTTFADGALGLGAGGGFSGGIFDDFEVDINGQEFSVPFVPIALQALEALTDVEILSQASLVTVDNEQSTVLVGQEVPFITNTSRPSTTDTGRQLTSGFTRINREDVGVKLTVTPQISEGDNVYLDLEIEISDVASASSAIGDPNIVGPTTNKTNLTNKVTVKDGSTAVIAGLIRDISDRAHQQSPILGDIPLLGNLFRSKASGQTKRNMVILVTPHIVKENVDLERLTKNAVDEYQAVNAEQFMDQGFIKKIRTKRNNRRNHRPTLDRIQAISSGEARFGRGDIKR